MLLQQLQTLFVSDWVQEDAFEPLEFELWFRLQQFKNDVSFDFHDFGGGFGSDSTLWWFVVCEIVRIEDVTETSDEVKIVVFFFDTARNNNVNWGDGFSFLYDLSAFLVYLLCWFHSDLNNLVLIEIWKKRASNKDLVKYNLLVIKLMKLYSYKFPINLFSENLKLRLINKSFLIKTLKFDFFMIE